MLKRASLLLIATAIIVSAIYFLGAGGRTGLSEEAEIRISEETPTSTQKEKIYPRAREIVNPAGFINTEGESITIAENIGKKVILIDFWTYSCINCQRTQPYLNAWYERYAKDGLLIVGIHTPEFTFEKDYENVLEAVIRSGIKYPVVLDNDYGTWSAYQNRYWPRKYLIDIDGFIVYDHIGEDAYEETEKLIQKLLQERAERVSEKIAIESSLSSEEIERGKNFALSPETYFGSLRNERTAQNIKGKAGTYQLEFPETFSRNTLYLQGQWEISPEAAKALSGDTKIGYIYSAKEVFIVADAQGPVEVEIWQDGKPLADSSKGADVDLEGKMIIQESRLYKIINNEKTGEHFLELRIKSGGARFYAFTFG